MKNLKLGLALEENFSWSLVRSKAIIIGLLLLLLNYRYSKGFSEEIFYLKKNQNFHESIEQKR